MSTPAASAVEPLLSVPGAAADHLYREGSAMPSFWETLFGASLGGKTRTRVSALPDGTRVFDVPLQKVEHELLRSAQVWMTSEEFGEMSREAAALLASKSVHVKLIGLQPRGQSVASFTLRFEVDPEAGVVAPGVPGAFRSWFGAERALIAEETLIPFGFTPQPD
jgi:hypothetical protein